MSPGVHKDVLVLGSTGRQGFAVARQLLNAGWDVRAMTRSPSSDRAKMLGEMGASVVAADFDNQQSLKNAARGAYAVFSVQDFWEAGYDREIEQGKRILDISINAQVDHFVYTSVGGVDRSEGRGILHFDTKREIEALVRMSGLRHSIFRPVTFFENFVASNAISTLLDNGIFQFPYQGDKPFQMVALDDLGFAVTRALEEPDTFDGLALELASETLTMNDFANALSIGSGRDISFQELSYERFAAMMNGITTQEEMARQKAGPSFLAQYHWHQESNPETGGWAADLASIDRLGLQRTSAIEWAQNVDWPI